MIRRCGLVAGVGAVLLAVGAAGQVLGKQPTVVPTGNWPVSVVAGDGPVPDGLVDLVYCDPPIAGVSDGCHLLRGDGKGGFSRVENYAGALPARQFTAAFANFSPTLHQIVTLSARVQDPQEVDLLVQLGNGDYDGYSIAMQGSKQVIPGPVQYFVYNQTADPLADNNRGFLVEDLANGYVYSTSDLGEPRFTMQLSGGAGPLLLGDLNGDGNNDFVVLGSSDHSATPYFGAGDGSFVAGTPYTQPGGIFSMLLADVNGDGKPDLVVEGVNGALSVFLATQGGFSTKAVPLVGAQDGVHGSGGHLVGVADLNGDGIADIVTSTPTGVIVLLGKGGLTYSADLAYNAGPGRSSYALADFNGDGHLDLAVDSPEGIAILYGNPQGGFDVGVTANTGAPAYSLALGKFTASGNTDAVVATGVPQVQVMNGDGTGNFLAQNAASPAGAAQTNAGRTVWSHVVAGDFDGDGKLDVGVSLDGPVETDLGPCCDYPASDNGLSVMFGDGTGGFGTPVAEGPTSSGAHYGMLAAVDLNGDGISDLVNYNAVVAGGYDGGPGYRLGMSLINIFGIWNDGYLRPYQLIATGYLKAGRTSAPDAVVESLGGSLAVAAGDSLSISVQKNDGKGTYSDGQQTFATPAGVAVTMPGSSALPQTGLYPSAMQLTDVDGDGNGDLLVLYHNLAADPTAPTAALPNLLYLFWGNGDGTFVATPTILTLSRNYDQLAVADVNGDGKPDLVMSDGYLVSVLAGDGTRSGFTQETHYLAGMGINALAVQDVNGDGKPEIVVANGGAVLSAGVVNRGVLAANAEVNTGGLTVVTPVGAATSPVAGTVSGTVTATPSTVFFADGITFSANLTGSGSSQPTGTVTFSVGSLQICSQTLANGIAQCNYTYTAGVAPIINAGTYTVTAQYGGDANYAATMLTDTTPLVVNPVVTTTTILGWDASIYYGQVIGDSATEQVSPGPDGGTIDFLIDGVVVCTLGYPVNPTNDSCPDSPAFHQDVGTYTAQSIYRGDSNYLGSSSAILTVTIHPDPTSATLSASTGTSSTVGQVVTFTAAIADLYATARGTVNFFDSGVQIGTGTVNASGSASFATGGLAVGTHLLTACLVASLDFLASSPCGSLTFTVNAAPPPPTGTFTLMVTPAALSVGVGNSVTAQVVVTALNGYSQPVQLACTGLPSETTCTFVQSLIGVGGGSTGMIVSPAAPHTCGSSTPDFIAPNAKSGLAGLALSVVALFGLRRRRRMVKALVLLVGLSLLPMLGGCGSGCKDFGTEPTSYTFTVTATSVGSPVTVLTQTVALKVHL